MGLFAPGEDVARDVDYLAVSCLSGVAAHRGWKDYFVLEV